MHSMLRKVIQLQNHISDVILLSTRVLKKNGDSVVGSGILSGNCVSSREEVRFVALREWVVLTMTPYPRSVYCMYTQRDSNVLGGVTAVRGIRFQTRTTYATC